MFCGLHNDLLLVWAKDKKYPVALTCLTPSWSQTSLSEVMLCEIDCAWQKNNMASLWAPSQLLPTTQVLGIESGQLLGIRATSFFSNTKWDNVSKSWFYQLQSIGQTENNQDSMVQFLVGIKIRKVFLSPFLTRKLAYYSCRFGVTGTLPSDTKQGK
jgi:hypothetical protein